MIETPNKKPGTGFDIGSAERVSEGNWEWMKADGFRAYKTLSQEEVKQLRHVPLNRQPDSLLDDEFGWGNVRYGDVYDPGSDRPLRHIPGMTIYVRDAPSADQDGQSGKRSGS
jgi:hypothetical protein